MSRTILNADIYSQPVNSAVQRMMSALMPRPGFIDAELLAQRGLVYTPFFEDGVLEVSDKIFARWSVQFESGLTVYQDNMDQLESMAPEARFTQASRIVFRSSECLKNGGFYGRFFVWLDQESFFYLDMIDASGICCREADLTMVLGCSLEDHLASLKTQLDDYEDPQERAYYESLIRNSTKR
jgi:hypothetical protein